MTRPQAEGQAGVLGRDEQVVDIDEQGHPVGLGRHVSPPSGVSSAWGWRRTRCVSSREGGLYGVPSSPCRLSFRGLDNPGLPFLLAAPAESSVSPTLEADHCAVLSTGILPAETVGLVPGVRGHAISSTPPLCWGAALSPLLRRQPDQNACDTPPLPFSSPELRSASQVADDVGRRSHASGVPAAHLPASILIRHLDPGLLDPQQPTIQKRFGIRGFQNDGQGGSTSAPASRSGTVPRLCPMGRRPAGPWLGVMAGGGDSETRGGRRPPSRGVQPSGKRSVRTG